MVEMGITTSVMERLNSVVVPVSNQCMRLIHPTNIFYGFLYLFFLVSYEDADLRLFFSLLCSLPMSVDPDWDVVNRALMMLDLDDFHEDEYKNDDEPIRFEGETVNFGAFTRSMHTETYDAYGFMQFPDVSWYEIAFYKGL